MGGSSGSKTKESSLSRKQADILGAREADYQAYFKPDLLNLMDEVSADAGRNKFAEGAMRNIEQASRSSLSQLSTQAARRGIEGSGFEAQGTAALLAAKANAQADALTRADDRQYAQRSGLLQLALQGTPQPTTAAPFHQSSQSGGLI